MSVTFFYCLKRFGHLLILKFFFVGTKQKAQNKAYSKGYSKAQPSDWHIGREPIEDNNKKNDELKDTLKQVAEYGEEEKKKLKKKMIDMSKGAAIILVFALVLNETNGFGFIPEHPCQNITYFALEFVLAILVLNILYFCGALDKIRTWKLSHFSKNRNK